MRQTLIGASTLVALAALTVCLATFPALAQSPPASRAAAPPTRPLRGAGQAISPAGPRVGVPFLGMPGMGGPLTVPGAPEMGGPLGPGSLRGTGGRPPVMPLAVAGRAADGRKLPRPLTLTVQPDHPSAGDPLQVLVRLNAPSPPGGRKVSLTSSDARVLSLPASVTIPRGSTCVSVTLVPLAPKRGATAGLAARTAPGPEAHAATREPPLALTVEAAYVDAAARNARQTARVGFTLSR